MKRQLAAGAAIVVVWSASASAAPLSVGGAASVGAVTSTFAAAVSESSTVQSACGTAYGLVTDFGSDPSGANYRAALVKLPPLFANVDGPVGVSGRQLAADWQRYSDKFLSGGALTDAEASVIVGDILGLAAACESAGQPAWHV